MAKITISLSTKLPRQATASNHGKRMARLRQAEEMQHKGYKISDLIKVLESPEFERFYRNDFQAYLKVKEDVLTTGDQHDSDDSYLNVVLFLNATLDTFNNLKPTEVGERDGLDNKGSKNNRMGERKGITYNVGGIKSD
jgi:hypothetical protein